MFPAMCQPHMISAPACACRLLEEITLVDTPGVLSGEKQRIERTYNFIDVCGWFAARCDLILLVRPNACSSQAPRGLNRGMPGMKGQGGLHWACSGTGRSTCQAAVQGVPFT